MRVFVTGGSGFIGSAVIPDLIKAGHTVVGLARSDAAAAKLKAAGAGVLRGDLNDTKALKAGAQESEGVIHLGFIHDFSNFQASLETDRVAIETMCEALAGSNRPLVIASGLLGLAPRQTATEDMAFNSGHPRLANALAGFAFKDRGVRVSAVRLSPTVHGEHDHGFIRTIADTAKANGVSAYIGDGANHWNAVHRDDAAPLFRLAFEKAPAGAVLHAVAEEAITTRAIAEAIGNKLGLPVTSVSADNAGAHFGWISRFFALDQAASSKLTQERMGWKPTHPTLLADLEKDYYFV